MAWRHYSIKRYYSITFQRYLQRNIFVIFLVTLKMLYWSYKCANTLEFLYFLYYYYYCITHYWKLLSLFNRFCHKNCQKNLSHLLIYNNRINKRSSNLKTTKYSIQLHLLRTISSTCIEITFNHTQLSNRRSFITVWILQKQQTSSLERCPREKSTVFELHGLLVSIIVTCQGCQFPPI